MATPIAAEREGFIRISVDGAAGHLSLTDLADGNLERTTGFQSIYGTMLKEWMAFEDTRTVLKGEFLTLGLFGS